MLGYNNLFCRRKSQARFWQYRNIKWHFYYRKKTRRSREILPERRALPTAGHMLHSFVPVRCRCPTSFTTPHRNFSNNPFHHRKSSQFTVINKEKELVYNIHVLEHIYFEAHYDIRLWLAKTTCFFKDDLHTLSRFNLLCAWFDGRKFRSETIIRECGWTCSLEEAGWPDVRGMYPTKKSEEKEQMGCPE